MKTAASASQLRKQMYPTENEKHELGRAGEAACTGSEDPRGLFPHWANH